MVDDWWVPLIMGSCLFLAFAVLMGLISLHEWLSTLLDRSRRLDTAEHRVRLQDEAIRILRTENDYLRYLCEDRYLKMTDHSEN